MAIPHRVARFSDKMFSGLPGVDSTGEAFLHTVTVVTKICASLGWESRRFVEVFYRVWGSSTLDRYETHQKMVKCEKQSPGLLQSRCVLLPGCDHLLVARTFSWPFGLDRKFYRRPFEKE